MKYWALIRSSRRLIEVRVYGSIFYVLHGGPAPHGWESVCGPFRRHDPKFRLMPFGWTP